MLGDSESAADVVQDAFIKLHEKMEGEMIGDKKSYLFIITRNLCLNRIRNRKKNVGLETLDSTVDYDIRSNRLKLLKLEKAIEYLDNDYREAIILKEFQGLSYDEIGGIMSLTRDKVRALLYKARIKLRENYMNINIVRTK